MTAHPNRGGKAKAAKAYAAALPGVLEVRIVARDMVCTRSAAGWQTVGTVAELAAKAPAKGAP